MGSDKQLPVLIAGGGPVGLTLAIELGMRGVACVLVEKRDGRVNLPKMSGVTSRGMEVARRWGLSKRVRAAGVPEDHPGDLVYFSDLVGPELARWVIPPASDANRLRFTPEPPCKCAQIYFDPILAAFVRTLPSVTVRYNTALEGFTENADWVVATLQLADGRREDVRASYLVGCDGPGSLVRETLGIGLEGLGVVARSVSIFFRSRELTSIHDKGWAHVYRSIDGNGCWSEMIPIDVSGLWKLTLFDVGAQAEDPASCLRRFAGRDFDFEVIAATPWDRRDFLARSYGRGRVYIAGDSAHECSPTGGLGMHTGIEESLNLAWKIAAMVQGWGGQGLLGSYEAERRPIARRNVSLATRSFKSIQSIPGFHPERGQTATQWHAELKEALARFVVTEFQKLQYCYEESSVCVSDGTPPPPENDLGFTPSARPGTRAPHFWLEPGRSFLDAQGFGFTLLSMGASAAEAAGFAAAADKRGMPFHVVTTSDAGVAEMYAARLALVRPDGHVAWRGNAAPSDPLSIIDRVRGAA